MKSSLTDGRPVIDYHDRSDLIVGGVQLDCLPTAEPKDKPPAAPAATDGAAASAEGGELAAAAAAAPPLVTDPVTGKQVRPAPNGGVPAKIKYHLRDITIMTRTLD
eukprot:COSAG01_NODE_22741_length_843_cov_1.033602_2_plen_106_part_00